MDVIRSMERERLAVGKFDGNGYIGNAGGYYEIGLQGPPPIAEMQGRVVKALRRSSLRFPPGDYAVILMRRDGEEARQSAQALFNRPLPAELAQRISDEMDETAALMRQRGDMRVLEVPYRKVVESPVEWFVRIRDAGWPIDPAPAAAIVDPALCRYRREMLDDGA